MMRLQLIFKRSLIKMNKSNYWKKKRQKVKRMKMRNNHKQKAYVKYKTKMMMESRI